MRPFNLIDDHIFLDIRRTTCITESVMANFVFWIVINTEGKDTYIFEYCRYRINALRASGMTECEIYVSGMTKCEMHLPNMTRG